MKPQHCFVFTLINLVINYNYISSVIKRIKEELSFSVKLGSLVVLGSFCYPGRTGGSFWSEKYNLTKFSKSSNSSSFKNLTTKKEQIHILSLKC